MESFLLEPAEEARSNSICWSIYADWLSDHGRYDEENRARAMAKGLEITGGKLFLFFKSGTGTMYLPSFITYIPQRVDKDGLNETQDYVWSIKWLSIYVETAEYGPVSPDDFPIAFRRIPKLIPQFWTEIAEIGRRALKGD